MTPDRDTSREEEGDGGGLATDAVDLPMGHVEIEGVRGGVRLLVYNETQDQEVAVGLDLDGADEVARRLREAMGGVEA